MARIDHLPYRDCVGIVLINTDKLIFTGERIDTAGAWQMPQGGIDDDERPDAAALRELGEETGLGPHHVDLISKEQDWLSYDLPADIIAKRWGGRYRGQRQLWYLMRLTASDDAIDIAGEQPEFARWRWSTTSFILDHIVPFKRALYTEVFARFAPYLDP